MPLHRSAVIQCQKQIRFHPKQRKQILFKHLYSIIHKNLSCSTGDLSGWRVEKFLKGVRWLQLLQVLRSSSEEYQIILKKKKKPTCGGLWCLSPRETLNKAHFENRATQKQNVTAQWTKGAIVILSNDKNVTFPVPEHPHRTIPIPFYTDYLCKASQNCSWAYICPRALRWDSWDEENLFKSEKPRATMA